MSARRISSRDVALTPQTGFNLAECICFNPADDHSFTYIRSSNRFLSKQIYAYDLRTDREELYIEHDEFTDMDTIFGEDIFQHELQRYLYNGVSRYQWSKNRTQPVMLITIHSDLYIFNRKRLRLLVSGMLKAPIIDPKISPDGLNVAYVQDCELHCISTEVSVPIAEPRRLTFDARGYPNKSNGIAEFIAQEEMERTEGFWWSDDSRFIAFTQIDESIVPAYQISHSGSDYPEHVEEHRYPFAGKVNVKVKVGIIDLQRNTDENRPEIYWVDLNDFDDYYVARVGFFPDNSLALQIENRKQTKLQLFRYDFLTNRTMTLLIEETSDAWINLHDFFYPLKSMTNRFLWASERTGYMHLELRDAIDGSLVKILTSGTWVVQNLVGVDENNRKVYFLANRETPVEIHLYSVNYDDQPSVVDRITQDSGCHNIYSFNHTYEYCLNQWNSIHQSPVVRLLDVKNKTVLKVFEHLQQKPSFIMNSFHFVIPNIFTISNRHGDQLYCALYQPDGQHDRYDVPYPTLISVYGGPRLQRVLNSWSLRSDMRCQRLVECGYAVLRVDNRGSLNRGVKFETAIRYDMGHFEIEDQVDGVNYLIGQGISDPKRIGIYGWSYGGYLSVMSLLRANEIFKLAIAGAPVTHWDGYDTHYTERYMGTPEENPTGYEVSSVIHHVEKLKGHLMIIHGLIDENVHFRHTARLINALIKAQKPYELVIFPDERHMPIKLNERIYMEERVFEFIRKYL